MRRTLVGLGAAALLGGARCGPDDDPPVEPVGETDLAEDTDDTDETGPPAVDADDDGSPEGEDCDDADPTRSPELPERCGDGADQDCDPRSECPAMCDAGYTLPAGACADAALPADAALRWSLDGDGADASGRGAAGVAQGEVVFSSGVLGLGAVFDGEGAIVAPRPSEERSFTLSTWLRTDAWPEGVEVDVAISAGTQHEPAAGLSLVAFPDRRVGMHLGSGASGGDVWISVYGDELACWRHVVVRNDGGSIMAWVDGRVVWTGEMDGDVAFSAQGFWVGGSPSSSSQGYRGALDEVVWYDRSLSDAEVGRVFHAAQCGHAP